jgi:DNA-binding transcriptional LysR family regulator
MLDVRRMQMLAAVVSNGSVTAAAARLGYTPSAISQQVAALEKEAGTALLERVGRGVRPTAAGLLLTEYADAIGRQVAEAETALGDLLAGRTGRLSVRYFATAGAHLVAPAVARLTLFAPAGVAASPANIAQVFLFNAIWGITAALWYHSALGRETSRH